MAAVDPGDEAATEKGDAQHSPSIIHGAAGRAVCVKVHAERSRHVSAGVSPSVRGRAARAPGPRRGADRVDCPRAPPTASPICKASGSVTPRRRSSGRSSSKASARLTDEEVAEFRRRAERLFKTGNSDFAVGDGVFQAVLTNPERYTNPNATHGASEMVDLEFDNRTSLIRIRRTAAFRR